jgi:hypothetical protein
MSMRSGLLGLLFLVAASGPSIAAPAPPINPQVEGRETSPISREFYQAEKSVERNGSGPEIPSRSRGEWVESLHGWGNMITEASQILLDRMAIPLVIR